MRELLDQDKSDAPRLWHELSRFDLGAAPEGESILRGPMLHGFFLYKSNIFLGYITATALESNAMQKGRALGMKDEAKSREDALREHLKTSILT